MGKGSGCGSIQAFSPSERTQMAKGQKRSGREAKKPKQDKAKVPAAVSPFTQPPTKPTPPASKK
jgi:hypothetical protein